MRCPRHNIRSVSLLSALTFCLVALPAWSQEESAVRAEANGATLELPKAGFQPGEKMELSFTAPEGLSDWAWCGVIPSDTPHGKASENDSHDVAYQYLNGKIEGTLEFSAPVKPGSYDIRLSNDAGTDDRELVSLTFTVDEPETDLEPSLTLEKSQFTSHEEFTVSFTVSAFAERPWIGLVPSAVAHGSNTEIDSHDVSWSYIYDQVRGEMSFRAPGPPGDYDLRLTDAGGEQKELASVSFSVSAPEDLASIEPTLAVDKKVFTSHEEFKVSFTAPIVYWYDAWIGLVPEGTQGVNASEFDAHDVSHGYLQGRTEGTVGLRVPGLPGKYELYMFTNTGTGGSQCANLGLLEVVLPEGGDCEPTLKLDKATYKPGEEIVVDFTAPAIFDYNSWLGIVPSEVEHGSTSTNDAHDVTYDYVYGRLNGTVKFVAPDSAGSYDVRLNNGTWLGDGKEHCHVTFTVAD